MRAYIPGYEVITPRGLPDALKKLQAQPDVWRPIAGGTDLMVLLEAGHLSHRRFINLWGLGELRGIRKSGSQVSIGALTTYSEIRSSAVLSRAFPMLGLAAGETGAVAIQNRGTIGGNIANASPAADTPPALLAYDAELELISTRGSRRVPYREFHTGYKKTVLRPDELIAQIHLNIENASGLRHFYRKVGTRRAQAISKVCVAAVLRVKGGVLQHVRIGLGSIAATPFRCVRLEAALRGKKLGPELLRDARAVLASEISPIDDIRSTSEYRLRVAGNLLEELLGAR